MNDQERQVIADIFGRLEQAAAQPRDPEAERFIAEKLREQPYAPYAMAQTIYVQEQALVNLNAEVERLRAEVDRAQRQPQSGGFLAGLFGGGARQPEAARQATGGTPWSRAGAGQSAGGFGGQPGGAMGFGQGAQAQGPWGGAARGGGGFLQTALGTAAGVAGGMMLGSALSNAFGGKDAAGGAQSALSDPAATDAAAGGNEGITDSLYQDASVDDQADFGSDLGGDGGDWA